MRKRFQWKYSGARRLGSCILGIAGKPSHEIAAHWLLFIGFSIEAIVLHSAIYNGYKHDFQGERAQQLAPLICVAIVLIILGLLYHQFMIFRNFSLPEKIAVYRLRKKNLLLAEKVKQNIAGKNEIDFKDISELAEGIILYPKIEVGATIRRKRKVCEIGIYLLFGVLTGEAGYMLTVLNHHPQKPSWLIETVGFLFGTKAHPWATTLECLFLVCAACVCGLVLWWDRIVLGSRILKDEFGEELIKGFRKLDLLSLLFWLFLFVIVTPSIRGLLGAEPITPEDAEISILLTQVEIGKVIWAWVGLFVSALFYTINIIDRWQKGLQKLKSAESDDESMITPV